MADSNIFWMRFSQAALFCSSIATLGMTSDAQTKTLNQQDSYTPTACLQSLPKKERRWFKGNVHTHTTASDGDETLDGVVADYDALGYDFVVITDHNKAMKESYHDPRRDILVIPGSELTTERDGKPTHVNAINYIKDGLPQLRDGHAERLEDLAYEARSNNGIAILNHPNWRESYNDTEMMQTQSARLFEIFNGHPGANNLGDKKRSSTENMWDRMKGERTQILIMEDSIRPQALRWMISSVMDTR